MNSKENYQFMITFPFNCTLKQIQSDCSQNFKLTCTTLRDKNPAHFQGFVIFHYFFFIPYELSMKVYIYVSSKICGNQQRVRSHVPKWKLLSVSSHFGNFVFGCFWLRSYQNITLQFVYFSFCLAHLALQTGKHHTQN